ncbi:MAG: DUF2188 domain-containing protein [Chitinophagales bacterium]|nr:DUF2188 domain-containing protein [Bacteroidota bacterium]
MTKVKKQTAIRKSAENRRKLTEKFSEAASTNSGRIHIVPSKDGWSVKKEGAKRSIAVRPTKEGALSAAKAVKSAERIIIHKKDGTIQKNTEKKYKKYTNF